MSALEEKLRAQFKRSHLSEQDFREAAEYLTAAAKRHCEIVRRALLTSAVIAYSRPFTKNEMPSEVWATSKVALKIGKELDAKEKALHTRLLELRNTALAHSDFSARPHDLRTTSEYGFSVSGLYFDILHERIDTVLFLGACQKLALSCRNKKVQLNAALFRLRNAA